MMNAEDWQAAAEVLGVLLIVLNGLVAMFIYRMQARFVTRAEHHAFAGRLDAVEDEVSDIRTTMAGLFTNDKADALVREMSEVKQQNAKLLGQLPEVNSSVARLSHQVDMLIQNELDGRRK